MRERDREGGRKGEAERRSREIKPTSLK